jgi:hypothetical protein
MKSRISFPNLLLGDETRFYGDSAYRGKEQRKRLRELAPRAKDFTNRRAYRNRPLSEADKAIHRHQSQVRAKVEHPFLTLQRLGGFAKLRYRGLARNANRAFAMPALINPDKWGRPLTGTMRPAQQKTGGKIPMPSFQNLSLQQKSRCLSPCHFVASVSVQITSVWLLVQQILKPYTEHVIFRYDGKRYEHNGVDSWWLYREWIGH